MEVSNIKSSYKDHSLAISRRGGRAVSASVSGSGGPGSDPGGVTWLTCDNFGQVIHSHLLRPTKLFTLPRSIY